MDRRQAEAFLRSVTWLADAPVQFQDQVLAKCDMVRFKKSDLIYDAGDEASGLFGVVEGYLELHLPAPGVAATLSYIGGPGSWFGDIAAVTGEPRRITIAAGTDCQLLRLPRLEIVRMTANDPALWRQFLLLLVSSNVKLMSLIWALKQDDPVKRVACLLLILSEEDLSRTGIAASQWNIAEMSDLGRSKVNAALKALEGRGHIRRRYGSIQVANATGLRDFNFGASFARPEMTEVETHGGTHVLDDSNA
jgi:CRP/FNR family transcriptional regulator, cyclic AMP receptor protein